MGQVHLRSKRDEPLPGWRSQSRTTGRKPRQRLGGATGHPRAPVALCLLHSGVPRHHLCPHGQPQEANGTVLFTDEQFRSQDLSTTSDLWQVMETAGTWAEMRGSGGDRTCEHLDIGQRAWQG